LGLGQLGLGPFGDGANEMGNYLTAVDPGTGLTIVEFSCGGTHTCILLDDDSLKCFGQNDDGQTGSGIAVSEDDTYYSLSSATSTSNIGDSLPAVNVGTGLTVNGAKGGHKHTCAILSDLSIKCWGDNDIGQLGQGHTNSAGESSNTMGDYLVVTELGSGRTASFVRLGESFSCAILDNGDMKCWGRNDEGQLGYGDSNERGDGANEMSDYLPGVNLGTGRTAIELFGGLFHTCAIIDDDSLKCWGSGNNRSLGYGDEDDRGDGAGQMGDYLPAVSLGDGVTDITSCSISPTPTMMPTPFPTPAPTPMPTSPSGSGNNDDNTAAIAGGAAAGGAVLCAGVGFFMWNQKKSQTSGGRDVEMG